MKKIIATMLTLFLMVACVSVTVPNVNISGKEKKQYCKVTVSKVKNSKKRVLIKVKMKNNSKDRMIFYGDSYELEEKVGKKWKKVKWIEEVAWNDLAHGFFHGGTAKKTYILHKDTLDTDFKKNKKYRIKMDVFTEKEGIEYPEKTRTTEIKYIDFKIK